MYRKVFEDIAEQDHEFADEADEAPSFGDSGSIYEDVRVQQHILAVVALRIAQDLGYVNVSFTQVAHFEQHQYFVPMHWSIMLKFNFCFLQVVGAFYGYWESYCTARSYVWEEKYDTRGAPNRAYRRAMEQENRKLRDKAKRERNEEVRVGMRILHT